MSTDMNKIVDKFKALGLGEKIILIAGPLLFIDSFLPWYKYDVAGFGGPSKSGWGGDGGIFSILAVLAALVMAAQITVARFTTVKMPALPQGFTWPKVHLGLAGIAAVGVVLRFIIGESTAGFDADRTFGLFIGVVVVAALAVGGFLMFREEMAASGGASRGTGTGTS